MSNTSVIAALWQQGDAVTHGVAILLLLMSITTWGVIMIKALHIVTLKKQSKKITQFWLSTEHPHAWDLLGKYATSPWKQLTINSCEALSHYQEKAQQHDDESSDLSTWLTRILRNTLSTIAMQLSSGLSVLASIGSTAPFVGLLGTVWGIYHALLGLSSEGATSIDKVSGPIGEALIMTAFGLAVAIPAVLGYNIIIRINRLIMASLNGFAHDLHDYLMTGSLFRPNEAHAKLVMKKFQKQSSENSPVETVAR